MKIKGLKNEILKTLKSFFLVVAGTLILSFAAAVFIIPFDLVVGGVSSIAILIEKLLPKDYLTTDMLVFILTWSLFFLGFVILGKGFAVKTFISTVIYPLGISLFTKLVSPSVLGGFFCLAETRYANIALSLIHI